MQSAIRIPVLALLTMALSACNADRTPATDAAATVTPATAPAIPVGSAATDARFDGYGDLRFGMTADEAKQAWGGELSGDPAEGEGCYHLSPKWVQAPAGLAFMVENDKFVRYSTDSGKQVAPGGGKVGMTADAIRQLYGDRVEEQPHEYVDGGKYLRIKDNAGNGVVLFATDAAGKVTEWRVGISPQVDYVEGCS